MKWNKFSNEMPELDKTILVLIKKNANHFENIFCSRLRRPYDIDKKCNPYYYEYFYPLNREWIGLTNDAWWCEIEFPGIYIDNE